MSNILGDTYDIVPRGVTAATVKAFDFQVRTIFDYDMNFLQDRVVSEIFVNGKPAGVYATTKVDGGGVTDSPDHALAVLAPELERQVIDEFIGLNYRKQVRQLERSLLELETYVNRPRWWQFHGLRREWRRFRDQLADHIRPKEEA